MLILIGILFNIFLSFSNGLEDIHWVHNVILDDDYHLFWTPGEEYVTMEIQAKTLGYVGIGFSPNGGMKGADILIGWVDDSGDVQFADYHGTKNGRPTLDESQDFTLVGGFENDTHTVIRFQRTWHTCDDNDFKLDNNTVRIIWALNPVDPKSNADLAYHEKRGVRSAYLQGATPSDPPLDDPHVKVWEIKSVNKPLPDDKDTQYWCRVFKVPELKGEHHMIGYTPVIQPGHESYVHHIVLYECRADTDELKKHFSMQAEFGKGEKCHEESMPVEWNNCLQYSVWAWAVGSEGEMLPDHVGFPFGEGSGGSNFYIMEIHYDNPKFIKDVYDNSGFKIYYTSELREHEAASLLVGHNVNHWHIIPPGLEEFKTVGRCPSECTSKGLPAEGVKMIGGLLHSHLAGKRMRLRHVRDGKELEPILEDNNYDFNYQVSRKVNERVALPGDEFIMECEFDTTGRNWTTYGGLGTREEMCLTYLIYYPRAKLDMCLSDPSTSAVMKAFGIDKTYPPSNPWADKGELIIKSPESLQNKTIFEHVFSSDWSDEDMINKLRSLADEEHFHICGGEGLGQDNFMFPTTDWPEFEEFQPLEDDQCGK